jgi:hypothetical protein
MKKVILILMVCAGSLEAIEKKDLLNVDLDEMTIECQPVVYPSGEDNMNLVWWIPTEFWKSLYTRDYNMSQEEINSYINLLEPYTIVAVVQSDISIFGAFKFYSLDEVQAGLKVTFILNKGQTNELELVVEKSPDLEIVLETMKPMLSNAMGNFGENFHFFVFSDRSPSGKRIADPYSTGELIFDLKQSDGIKLTSKIETPLNCLYVPRKCPNGKPAHITWKYCPWTGEKLPD